MLPARDALAATFQLQRQCSTLEARTAQKAPQIVGWDRTRTPCGDLQSDYHIICYVKKKTRRAPLESIRSVRLPASAHRIRGVDRRPPATAAITTRPTLSKPPNQPA